MAKGDPASVTVAPVPNTTAVANVFTVYGTTAAPPPSPDPLDAAAAAGWEITLTLAPAYSDAAYCAMARRRDRYLSVIGYGDTPTQALQEMLRRIAAHGEPTAP